MANYLKMRSDLDFGSRASDLMSSDMNDIAIALNHLANHAMLGGLDWGTSLLKWFACAAAIYLLILDRTNWKTNILTSLLIPYTYLSLPTLLYDILNGEIGMWIAFVAVVLRLFFPKSFPDWLDLPAALILLLVVTPALISEHIRIGLIGICICLAIGCYLLQEHIRASGGFRNSFTKSNGISNSIGILLLFVYPAWALVMYIL